jgi:RNA polymerase sigma-70 factor, ECF subfamily
MAIAPDRGRATHVEPLRRREAGLAEDLFAEYHRRIYAYCLAQLRSPEEAEDAVQATYLNACRSLMGGFEPEAAQAWLFKVAQNVCLTKRRASYRRSRVERTADLNAVEDSLPGLSDGEAGEELMGIESALAELSEQQRRAILLREWQGLSYREVAAELEISQSAVETLIFRARRALAAALEPPAVEGEPPPERRRRLLHAFDAGALVASLKSSLASGLSGGLATGVAVAASATLVVTAPVGRTFDLPRAAEQAKSPVAARRQAPTRRPARPDAAGAVALAAAQPKQGPPAHARSGGNGKAKGRAVAHGSKGHGHRRARPQGAGKAAARLVAPVHSNAGGQGNAHGKR